MKKKKIGSIYKTLLNKT